MWRDKIHQMLDDKEEKGRERHFKKVWLHLYIFHTQMQSLDEASTNLTSSSVFTCLQHFKHYNCVPHFIFFAFHNKIYMHAPD